MKFVNAPFVKGFIRMGEKSNAERFLAAYQTIDEIVRKNANDVPEAKLVDVIPKAALGNYVIHMIFSAAG